VAPDRKLHLEAPGLVESRTIQFTGGRLPILKGPNDWLEFERVEWGRTTASGP
jgi:hypothetical protein